MDKYLITGGRGFLGKYISDHMSALGFQVETLGRGSGNSIVCDLSLRYPSLDTHVDIVVHCAGKAHIFPRTEREKIEYSDVNVNGMKNLLIGLDAAVIRPKSFIFISSVSVYGKDEGLDINEHSPLLANDPYGQSKIGAESIIREWCDQNNVKCTILRLPLVAGQNPPGNLKAMINSIAKGYYFNVSSGRARKSIVMAQDVAELIPRAANIGGIFNLTDGYNPSFKELSVLIANQLNKRYPISLPVWMEKILVFLGNYLGFFTPFNAYRYSKLTSSLTFDDRAARETLGWNPRQVLQNFKIR
ncbi:MAG TPA: NAD-dependent epimerase/dehydratase family protein [Pedobacter sp.]|uniref:NAD-dependent epimerase/dehydratase family protein n=1 Tax=Pedobacter sp. TaxID=1411316 RepID=UPI002BE99505|nr:NAD-dependent epimerase/dehydratase family protein [Pedobacter sp.]HMI00864.1 NAD-dependent epimerase/dehydratase family protein [Pedobacter sp.]